MRSLGFNYGLESVGFSELSDFASTAFGCCLAWPQTRELLQGF